MPGPSTLSNVRINSIYGNKVNYMMSKITVPIALEVAFTKRQLIKCTVDISVHHTVKNKSVDFTVKSRYFYGRLLVEHY